MKLARSAKVLKALSIGASWRCSPIQDQMKDDCHRRGGSALVRDAVALAARRASGERGNRFCRAWREAAGKVKLGGPLILDDSAVSPSHFGYEACLIPRCRRVTSICPARHARVNSKSSLYLSEAQEAYFGGSDLCKGEQP